MKKKNIPEIPEWEGESKNLFPNFETGKGTKKIHSHTSGTGIRGYHSQECQGMGTGMEKTQYDNEKEYMIHSQMFQKVEYG